MKRMFVYGTRPDAIKLAPLMSRFPDDIIVNTGQHRDLPTDVLDFFGIKDKYNLSLMTQNQTLESFFSRCLQGVSEVIKKESPDIVVVQGDTATALASAMAAFYNMTAVAHVEAGMRTYHKYSPFPEEVNRMMVDCIVDRAFCPRDVDTTNILNPQSQVYVTGNTTVDALNEIIKQKTFSHPLESQEDYLLVTCHRRENHGEPLERVIAALNELADKHRIIFVTHPNPNVQKSTSKINHPNIIVKGKLSYLDMLQHIVHSQLILTDSGGLHEEGPACGKRLVYLREVSELPHIVDSGWAFLAGTDKQIIIDTVSQILSSPNPPALSKPDVAPTDRIEEILRNL